MFDIILAKHLLVTLPVACVCCGYWYCYHAGCGEGERGEYEFKGKDEREGPAEDGCDVCTSGDVYTIHNRAFGRTRAITGYSMSIVVQVFSDTSATGSV